jgi:hypothetical protein
MVMKIALPGSANDTHVQFARKGDTGQGGKVERRTNHAGIIANLLRFCQKDRERRIGWQALMFGAEAGI